MTEDEQFDRNISEAMHRILAYATSQLPNTVFCLMSFTDSPDGEREVGKIIANCMDRLQLGKSAARVLEAFVQLPNEEVIDLRNTNGTMQ